MQNYGEYNKKIVEKENYNIHWSGNKSKLKGTKPESGPRFFYDGCPTFRAAHNITLHCIYKNETRNSQHQGLFM